MNCAKLSILSILLFSLTCTAKTYAPIFTGNWYTQATFESQDSCYQDGYHYTNYGSGPDQLYASKVLSDLSEHSDCQWGKVFLTAKNNQRPVDFLGTYQQWRDMRSTTATAETWQRDCLNQKKTIIDSTSTMIWPSYACPTGTHYGLENGTFSCTDAPLACSADIVGRDIVWSNFPKLFGHVGLTVAQAGKTYVLEVLPKPPAIYLNTLASFMAKSKYWGEKYGLKGTEKLTSEQATAIVEAGKEQKPFKLEYTEGWDYHPGNETKKPKFRCDSYVYYCYEKGAGLKIFPNGFKIPDTPPMILFL